MNDPRVELARALLGRVRLQNLIGDDGRPTDAAFAVIEAGTLSSGELTMLSVAMAVIDFNAGSEVGRAISRLLLLDAGNLRAVAIVLLAMSRPTAADFAALADNPMAAVGSVKAR
jgi:hypothetical protein